MKIRIGNDFVFNWAIERGGLPEDLESVLEAKLTASVFGKKQDIPFTISGNIITIEFTPEICNIIGLYNLLFTYILPDLTLSDEERKCAVDVDAFQIVAKTAQADDSTEFSMTSDMAIAFKGDKGDSAYQVWLDEGNTGTEEDYFAYLRQPAVDAGASISELEGEIQVNEGLRIQAESERAQAFAQMMGEADDKIEEMDTTLSTYDGRVTQVEYDISQLAGDVEQAVKRTDSKIYIGAVTTELDWMYNGGPSIARNGAVLSDGRFICSFGYKLTTHNDVMGISWQRADINPTSNPYEIGGYIYVSDATTLYKLTLEGVDVKTYPISNITSVAVAPNGNIVVGRSGPVGEKTVVCMDNDGLELWHNTEIPECSAVDIDSNGNVLTGHYTAQAGDGLRIYNSVGVKQKQSSRSYIVDAKFDKEDNVVVVAAASSAGLSKFSKELTQLWVRGEIISSYNARTKLSIGDDNTIYAPSFSTAAGTIDCYRFTADGDFIYKFASGGAARASSLVSDNNGYVYLTSSLSSNNTMSRFKEYNKVRIW